MVGSMRSDSVWYCGCLDTGGRCSEERRSDDIVLYTGKRLVLGLKIHSSQVLLGQLDFNQYRTL